MKKTIKYGGLVAGVATVAAAMGATPVFADAPYVDVDSTGCAEKNISVDDSTSDKKVAALKNQAAAYTKLAACETNKAETLKADVDAAAKAAGNLTAKNSDGTTNYDKLATEKAQPIVTKATEDYGVDTFDDDVLVDNYLDGSEGWEQAKEDLDKVGATNAEILAYIRANNTDDKYEVAEIMADFAKANAAKAVVEGVTAMNAATAKAENYTKAAAADEEAIAEILADAKKDAEDTAEAEAEAIEAAEKAIADAEEAGADAEIISKLNTILDAAKKGEDHYDLEAVVAAANDAKTKADKEAEDAEKAMNDAKNNYKDIVDGDFATDASDNVTKGALQDKIDEVKEKYDVEAIDKESFKAVVGEEVYNEAIKALKDEGLTEDEIELSDIADLIYQATEEAKGSDATAAELNEKAGDYLDANDAANLIDLVDKNAAAQKAVVKAAAVAEKVADAATEIGKVDDAVEAAAEAAKTAADVAKAAGETPETPSDDDNKGDEDNTKTYTYATLSDSETAYVAGNALVLHFDAPFEDFDYLTIDGVTIDPAMYTVADGSTKITLSSALLDTLKSGEHTVVAYYKDGKTATAKFTIASAEVATPNTGAYTAEAASATSSVSAVVSAIMAATLAGAAVVLRKRSA